MQHSIHLVHLSIHQEDEYSYRKKWLVHRYKQYLVYQITFTNSHTYTQFAHPNRTPNLHTYA